MINNKDVNYNTDTGAGIAANTDASVGLKNISNDINNTGKVKLGLGSSLISTNNNISTIRSKEGSILSNTPLSTISQVEMHSQKFTRKDFDESLFISALRKQAPLQILHRDLEKYSSKLKLEVVELINKVW